MPLSDHARLLITLGSSVFLATILTPVARWYARRAGFVAHPTADRWHRRPTALLGGPAIVAAAVGAFLFFYGLRLPGRLPIAWIAGALFISAIGLYDDLRGLRPSSKLIAQILAALLPIGAGLGIPGFHPLVSFWVTLLWIVGITNAVNLLDNMDGLAAGIAAIASGFLSVHALQAGDLTVAAAGMAITGAALGFLVYNFNPASIFMGDGGSLFLGYSLGTLSLMRTTARPLVSLSIIAVPVFVLAIPIFDTALVTLLRLSNRRSIAQGGRDHSSHRLVSLGLSERRAVVTLYAVAAVAGLLSLSFPHLPASLVVLSGLVTLLAIYYFGATLGSAKVYEKDPAGIATARDRGLFVFDTVVRHKQRIVDVALDLVIVATSYLLAYLLRFEGTLSPRNIELVIGSLPFLIAVRLLFFFAFGLYRTIPGAFSVHDFVAIAKAVAVSSAIFVCGLVLLTRFADFSRAVIVIDAVFTLSGIVFSRIALHSVKELLRGLARSDRAGVLIVGAGTLGEAATRLLRADEKGRYRIIGFLDDGPDKIGRSLHGYRVMGPLSQAEAVLSAEKVATVVFASSKLPAAKREAVEEVCRRLSVEIQEVTIR